jgi:hypothetical protein
VRVPKTHNTSNNNNNHNTNTNNNNNTTAPTSYKGYMAHGTCAREWCIICYATDPRQPRPQASATCGSATSASRATTRLSPLVHGAASAYEYAAGEALESTTQCTCLRFRYSLLCNLGARLTNS